MTKQSPAAKAVEAASISQRQCQVAVAWRLCLWTRTRTRAAANFSDSQAFRDKLAVDGTSIPRHGKQVWIYSVGVNIRAWAAPSRYDEVLTVSALLFFNALRF